MANVNVAYGLKPIGKLGQATNSTGMTEYRIAVANTNPIFQGMPVIPLAAELLTIYKLRLVVPSLLLVFLADVSIHLQVLVK
tara:strand:- start:384 stop:629 length:246 start_codon:yes stop_codon:yes gene_type:complete